MTRKNTRATFDIQSIHLSLVSFILKTTDINALKTELEAQFGNNSNYFEGELIVIDLSLIESEAQSINFTQLLTMLKNLKMHPFAVSGGSVEQLVQAKQAGLFIAPQAVQPPAKASSAQSTPASAAQKVAATHQPTKTMIIDRPLRSGQQVYAKDSDLIVTSLVNHGAEVIADGNIHVYAPLRGRVIAGAKGDTQARIFSTCFEPELFSIAGVFRTTDQELPKNIMGKTVAVHLAENSLITTAL